MDTPEQYILTTDFATLKNDAVSSSFYITLPASVTIAAATTYMLTQDISMGVSGASIRATIHSTADGTRRVGVNASYSSMSGATVDGYPTYWTIYVFIHKVSANTVRLSVMIPNQHGSSSMVVTGLARTITATVATFLPPNP